MKKMWFGTRGWWILLLLVLPVTGVMAQSVADDTQQLLMDVQKLSQLKQILSQMYKEYTIVNKGYEDIKALSKGTFNLHKAFLDGLLAVSPTVASYVKIVDIIDKEAALVKEYHSASGYLNGSGRFTSQELGSFLTMYNNLIQGSLNNVAALTMVVTAGQLRMSDAERLAAIDRIDRDMTGRLSFLESFDHNAVLQAMLRAKEA